MSDADIEKYRKHDIVYFHKYGATIFTVIGDTSQYEGLANVLIDPDYTLVKGHPPHHWMINNATLALLPSDKIKERDEYHKNTVHHNPKVIRVETTVEKVIENIKEIPIEVIKLVREYRTPKWIYYSHSIMALLIIILIIMMRRL